MVRKQNDHLASLFDDTGWTERQMAQAINRIGTERGTPTTCQQPSVHQWLNGSIPRASTRPLILEALSRKLGYPISPGRAGFPEPPEQSLAYSIAESLIDLGRQDMERRNFLGSAALFSVAMNIPEWQETIGRAEVIHAGEARRIGMGDVEMVRKMTEFLSDTYDQFGGRHARPMAAAFLVNTVSPYLRADAKEDVRQAMMSAASTLCYLTGWMAVDDELHGLAQRYYIKGLELAREGGDHLTYCHVLRGMSVQAADLGHGREAVRFADAAAAAVPRVGPQKRAFFVAQQGYASAVAGEGRAALHHVRETEKALDIAESGTATFGGFNHSTLAYAVSHVRYQAGDIKGSVDSLNLHFRLRDTSDTPRSAARFNSLLAERQMEMGHLDAACATWSDVLDIYPEIHSGRVDRHVANIVTLLRPHLANGGAREVSERARLAIG
ncbi:tetratricopeptide repeat protein [Streptomyces sp. NPDC000594]|uniref:tetratricopeptide repeat protein n=1 Tax=Streptomyces sp. NPDC000594 TaxID=3154261 RepID=UPI003321F527